MLLLLSKYQPLAEHLLCLPRRHAPLLNIADLRKVIRVPVLALANFCLAVRNFTRFGQTGTNLPWADMLSQANHVLRSFTVNRGDFYPGTVESARFAAQAGWHIGTFA